MVEKNKHAQRSGCPVACALDIIGDHWSLLVIRNLMFADRHEYKDMMSAEEGISSNILVDRLRKLEMQGLISSIPHPKSRRRKMYYLTDKGKGLIHIMVEICRWSEHYLNDTVDIPEDRLQLVQGPPQAMIEHTLAAIETWEHAHGIS